jgi:serine carboxypeptidase-like clade IV
MRISCAGNGLTDPAIQYGAYADFAYENGLIGEAVHKSVNAAYPSCKYGIAACNEHKWPTICKAALAYCQSAIFGSILLAAGNINVYDIRKKCKGALCYDFSPMEEYLAKEDVRKALGVGNRKWKECDPTVYGDFIGDWMINVCRLSALFSTFNTCWDLLGCESCDPYSFLS